MPSENDHTASRSSQKLKRLWISAALSAAVVLCAPLIQKLLGLPPFPLRIQVTTGAITFGLLVPALWIALSPRSDVTRHMALIALAVILVFFALLLWWLHPWSLHT